jgi:hypothetical protein
MLVCNDGKACTVDKCDPVKGCVFSVGCDDKNPCTVDSCDLGTGLCVSIPLAAGVTCVDIAQGKPCSDLIPCAMACPVGTERPKCLADCAKIGTTAAQTDFNDLGTCAADLCKEATNTVAANSCIADKCLDMLAKCGDWGGNLGCLDTVQCSARCALGDDPCRAECLAATTKEAAKAAAAVIGCGGTKCGGANTAESFSACFAANCAAPLATCKGPGLDCTGLFGCQAKCPTPVLGKPNACAALCKLFATDDSVMKHKKLADCKESCQGAINKAECIAKDCQPDRIGCFGKGGSDICQTINTCVVDKCQGIGGDPKCVAECAAKGKTYDQEAFLTYEGCIVQKLDEPAAETLGCTFPYDLNTCIGSLNKGCSNQYLGCFKPL